MNIHGLSPLARGTPSPRSGGAHAERFIPAGAGNTSKCSRMLSSCMVYPRWRGGTQLLAQYLEEEHRFIPAGAGTRLSAWWPEAWMRVYPPLARGTHFGNRTGSTGHRFIPAGAGNTQKHGAALVLRWFIPAGAGNTSGYFIEFINITVYPPLARGTPDRQSRQNPARRFIPAGAGNPPVFFRGISVSGFIPAGAGNTKDILLFYNSFLSTQQFTNFITTISHY